MRVAGAVLLALLSAALQFGAVRDTRIDTPVRGDARDYVAYAINLKLHGVYSRAWPDGTAKVPASDAVRGPGYPLLLASVATRHGSAWDFGRVLDVQAVMGVLTVLCYLALYRRFLSDAGAFAAAALTAISPHLVNTSVYLLSESLFTCLLAMHLLVLEQALRQRTLRGALLAGALLALSMLTRSTTQYLGLVYFIVWLLWPVGARKPDARWLAALLLPVLLATGAWSWRNVAQIGSTSDPTLAANFIQHGSYVDLMYDGRPESYGYPYRFDPRNAAISGRMDRIVETLFERARAEPWSYLRWYLVGKPLTFLQWDLTESVGDAFIFPPLASPYRDRFPFRATHDVARALHPALMCLALAGAIVGLRRAGLRPAAALLAVALAYFIALHMIGTPLPRYSIPVRPICYGLALYALQCAWSGWRERRRAA